MRIAICAFSAVLLSGCSWMGGGGQSNSYGYEYGGSCGGAQAGGQYGGGQYGYAQHSSYGYQSAGGCGAQDGYAVAGGYGQAGYGQAGYGAYGANGYGPQGPGANLGLRGAQGGYAQAQNGYGANGHGAFGANGQAANGQGAFGYGQSMYGSSGAAGYGTMLGGAAPYGAAVGGGAVQYAGGGQAATAGHFVNGQWIAGGGSATHTVVGSPIYVPQPYPAYYGVGYNAGYAGGFSGGSSYGYGMRGASASLPFGLEASIGTEFGVGGDIVGAKPAGPGSGGGANPLNVSATPAIAYKDAYKNAVNYSLGATYDISPSTTVLARLGYSNAKGQSIQTGTIDDGTVTEDLYAQWSDLEQYTIEGGVRQYMGGWNNGVTGMRPYVGATAGFTHNNAVSLEQSSATLMPTGANVQSYLDAGWTPTATGVVGAEMQVGPRAAIGVETGIRWRDDINSIQQQDDRWSIPLQLRGRVSF